MDTLLHIVHVEEVILPAGVDDLEHHGALDAAHLFGADLALTLVVLLESIVDDEVDDLIHGHRSDVDVALFDLGIVDLFEGHDQ